MSPLKLRKIFVVARVVLGWWPAARRVLRGPPIQVECLQKIADTGQILEHGEEEREHVSVTLIRISKWNKQISTSTHFYCTLNKHTTQIPQYIKNKPAGILSHVLTTNYVALTRRGSTGRISPPADPCAACPQTPAAPLRDRDIHRVKLVLVRLHKYFTRTQVQTSSATNQRQWWLWLAFATPWGRSQTDSWAQSTAPRQLLKESNMYRYIQWISYLIRGSHNLHFPIAVDFARKTSSCSAEWKTVQMSPRLLLLVFDCVKTRWVHLWAYFCLFCLLVAAKYKLLKM